MDQSEKLLRVQLLNQYSDSYIAVDTTLLQVKILPLVWQKFHSTAGESDTC
jgi:hypothetical protein